MRIHWDPFGPSRSDLLSRESLGTAAIEGELLDPGQVRSSIGQTAAAAARGPWATVSFAEP